MSRGVFQGMRVAIAGVGFAAGLVAAVPASAQTTVVLDAPGREVVDTTIRGGSYANKNFGSNYLETRASGDRTYVRRALLKFDTENFVPARAAIRSATLTLTVKGGNDATRTLSAYRISESFDEGAATWNDRKAGLDWRTTGASLGSRAATATVRSAAGSKVSFNVTALVQSTVNGTYGSRYTRIAVIDNGSSSRDSYRQFYSSEASDPSVRPLLTVVYGGSSSGSATADSAPPPKPSSGKTLRVFHWNLHHGVGTDGRYDIDRIAKWIAKSNPDVVSLNEVEKNTWWGNEDQPGRYKALLQAKTGRTWYAVWAQEYGDWNSAGKGNLILSRYPWSSTARQLFSYDRTIALGQINVNGRNITFASTHLDPDSGSRRLKQAKELAGWADNYADGRIICGDMNAQPTSSEMTYLKQTYRDAWEQAKSGGFAHSASDNKNGYTRNSRIDFCLTSKTASHLTLTRVEVVDTRDANSVRPSDHRPILAVYNVH